MSIFGGGGSSQSTPNPPQPVLANISQLQNQALGADIQGYNLSDQDLSTRFPGLVAARNQQIGDAYNQLTGPLDSTVQNQFVNQGLQQSYGAFGSGNPYATISKNAASGKAVETSLANNVQKKQDYDRTNFENLLGLNPQRAFGLTGADIANLTAANTTAQNNYAQSLYGAQYGNYNAGQAASGQQQSALIGTGASIAGALIIAL